MITEALAEAAIVVGTIVPLDIVELVKAIFMGLGALGGVFATIYLPWLAARQKRQEATTAAVAATVTTVANDLVVVKSDVGRMETNTNSMQKTIEQLAREKGQREGEARAEAKAADTAATLAEGQKQGAEAERASPSPIGTKPPQ